MAQQPPVTGDDLPAACSPAGGSGTVDLNDLEVVCSSVDGRVLLLDTGAGTLTEWDGAPVTDGSTPVTCSPMSTAVQDREVLCSSVDGRPIILDVLAGALFEVDGVTPVADGSTPVVCSPAATPLVDPETSQLCFYDQSGFLFKVSHRQNFDGTNGDYLGESFIFDDVDYATLADLQTANPAMRGPFDCDTCIVEILCTDSVTTFDEVELADGTVIDTSLLGFGPGPTNINELAGVLQPLTGGAVFVADNGNGWPDLPPQSITCQNGDITLQFHDPVNPPVRITPTGGGADIFASSFGCENTGGSAAPKRWTQTLCDSEILSLDVFSAAGSDVRRVDGLTGALLESETVPGATWAPASAYNQLTDTVYAFDAVASEWWAFDGSALVGSGVNLGAFTGPTPVALNFGAVDPVSGLGHFGSLTTSRFVVDFVAGTVTAVPVLSGVTGTPSGLAIDSSGQGWVGTASGADTVFHSVDLGTGVAVPTGTFVGSIIANGLGVDAVTMTGFYSVENATGNMWRWTLADMSDAAVVSNIPGVLGTIDVGLPILGVPVTFQRCFESSGDTVSFVDLTIGGAPYSTVGVVGLCSGTTTPEFGTLPAQFVLGESHCIETDADPGVPLFAQPALVFDPNLSTTAVAGWFVAADGGLSAVPGVVTSLDNCDCPCDCPTPALNARAWGYGFSSAGPLDATQGAYDDIASGIPGAPAGLSDVVWRGEVVIDGTNYPYLTAPIDAVANDKDAVSAVLVAALNAAIPAGVAAQFVRQPQAGPNYSGTNQLTFGVEWDNGSVTQAGYWSEIGLDDGAGGFAFSTTVQSWLSNVLPGDTYDAPPTPGVEQGVHTDPGAQLSGGLVETLTNGASPDPLNPVAP